MTTLNISGVPIVTEEGRALLRALQVLQSQVEDQEKELQELRMKINLTESRIIKAISEALHG